MTSLGLLGRIGMALAALIITSFEDISECVRNFRFRRFESTEPSRTDWQHSRLGAPWLQPK